MNRHSGLALGASICMNSLWGTLSLHSAIQFHNCVWGQGVLICESHVLLSFHWCVLYNAQAASLTGRVPRLEECFREASGTSRVHLYSCFNTIAAALSSALFITERHPAGLCSTQMSYAPRKIRTLYSTSLDLRLHPRQHFIFLFSFIGVYRKVCFRYPELACPD